MNNFKALMRVELFNLFDMRSVRARKSAKKRRATVVAYAIMIPTILFLSSFYSLMLVYGLDALGGASLVIPFMAAVTCIATFTTGIIKPSGTLFKARYNDMLFSMPIKLSTIVAARLANIYIFTLAMDSLIMIPAAVIYAVSKAPGVMYYVNLVFCLAALPLIPLSLASVIGTLISAAASRFRYKNLLTIVLSIAALMAYIAVVFSFSFSEPNEMATLQMVESFSSMMTRIYPPVALISGAIAGENPLYMLAFVALSAAVAALFCMLISRFYLQISSRMSGAVKKKAPVALKEQKASSVRAALLRREFKRYLSIPVYVLNTFTGMAMLILFTVAIIFAGEQVLGELIDIPEISALFTAMLPFIMGFLITMTSTSASSISLEGKQLWILRSSPVKESEIFNSKIELNLAVTMPITLICSVALAIALRLTGVSLALMILTPLAYCSFTSVLGLVVNLHFPKLDWSSETQAVKQSASVLISIMVGMVLSLGPLGVLLAGVDPATLGLIVIITLVAVTAFLLYYLSRRGRVLWERI